MKAFIRRGAITFIAALGITILIFVALQYVIANPPAPAELPTDQ